MRPFPAATEYGSWDKLPTGPAEEELDLSNPDVKDALARRELLINQWSDYRNYPNGHWREEAIRHSPDHAEAWRNWLTRRSWEGVNQINGFLRRCL